MWRRGLLANLKSGRLVPRVTDGVLVLVLTLINSVGHATSL